MMLKISKNTTYLKFNDGIYCETVMIFNPNRSICNNGNHL